MIPEIEFQISEWLKKATSAPLTQSNFKSYSTQEVNELTIPKKIILTMDIRENGINSFVMTDDDNNTTLTYGPTPENSFIHYNNYYGISYVLQGTFTFGIPGDDIQLHTNDMIIFDTKCIYWDKLGDPNTIIININIPKQDFLDMSASLPSNRLFSWLLDTHLDTHSKEQHYFLLRNSNASFQKDRDSILASLIQEQNQGAPGYLEIMWQLIKRLLIYTSQQEHGKYQVVQYRKKECELLLQLQKYIQEHLHDINRQNLAEKFHYNPRYLSQLFKQISGITLTEYLQEKRLTESKRLLLGTRERV